MTTTQSPRHTILTGTVTDLDIEHTGHGEDHLATIDTETHGTIEVWVGRAVILPEVGQRITLAARENRDGTWRIRRLRPAGDEQEVTPWFDVLPEVTENPNATILTGTVVTMTEEHGWWTTIDTETHGAVKVRIGELERLPEVGERVRFGAEPSPMSDTWGLRWMREEWRRGQLPARIWLEILPDDGDPVPVATDEANRRATVDALQTAREALMDGWRKLSASQVDPCDEMGALTFPLGLIDREIRRRTRPPGSLAEQLRDIMREVDGWEECVEEAMGRRDDLIRRILALREAGDEDAADLNLRVVTGMSRQRLHQIKHGTR